MKVAINGEVRELPEGATAADAAELAGIEPGRRGTAVAVDGEVVPRAELGGRELEPDSRIEIVIAIQGGSR